MPKIVIGDAEDNVIGAKERSEVLPEDRHPVAAPWIANEKGEILLVRRAFNKSHDPGGWGPAAAGTVEEGESHLENIIKEAQEELGLADISPELGPKLKIESQHAFFAQWFTIQVESGRRFSLQAEEVTGVKRIPSEDLKALLRDTPHEFVKSSLIWPELFPVIR